MVGNTNDGTDGARPQRLWWSAIEDPTDWPTPGSDAAIQVQSDYQELVGEGGWIQALVPGLASADVLVIQERALVRGIYVGQNPFWTFDPIEGGRGTPAPNSAVQVGGQVYYLGQDGFYRSGGLNSEPIGLGKVDRWFLDNADPARAYERMSAAADPINRLVMWSFPSTNSADGVPDTLLIFSWETGEWARADAVAAEFLLRALTFGSTLDDLDDISASLDDLGFSLDSRTWAGGRLLLGAFNTDHKLAYFEGDNAAATLITGETNLAGGQRRAMVSRLWPLVEADGGATVTARIGTRNRVGDAVDWGAEASLTDDGFCAVDAEGRYHRARVDVAAGGEWDFARGVDLTAVARGRL